MTAEELIALAAACTVCGEEHQQRAACEHEPARLTWAAEDGHSYRPRLFDLTGHSTTTTIAALRALSTANC